MSFNVKICKICKKTFKGTYNKETCSDKCKKELYFKNNEKNIKCEYCGIIFKTLGRKTCSKVCKNKLSGLKNIGNNWHHSEEAKRKISIGRKVFLSKPKNLDKHRKYTKDSWKNIETREKRLTVERAKKISETGKRLYREGKKIPVGHSRGKITLYKNKKFKSTWEAKVAKWLDNNNIKWEYESKDCRISLVNNRTYFCDFYLPNLKIWVEVKGWWNKYSLIKCKELIKQKGFNKLYIIDSSNINNISLDTLFYEYTSDFNVNIDSQIENFLLGKNI